MLYLQRQESWVGRVAGDSPRTLTGGTYARLKKTTAKHQYIRKVAPWVDDLRPAGASGRRLTGRGKQVGGKPVFMIGGESRLPRRLALLTENYFSTGSNDGLLMFGIRFLGEKFSVDLALMNSVRTPVFPGIPYVDFVIKW